MLYIRLEAKIITAANAFYVLMSNRVYKSELDTETACNILRMGKAKLYDPYIMGVFFGGI